MHATVYAFISCGGATGQRDRRGGEGVDGQRGKETPTESNGLDEEIDRTGNCSDNKRIVCMRGACSLFMKIQ